MSTTRSFRDKRNSEAVRYVDRTAKNTEMTKGEVIRRSVLLAKQAGLFDNVESSTRNKPEVAENSVENTSQNSKNNSGDGVRAVDVSQDNGKEAPQKSNDTSQQSDPSSESENGSGWFDESSEWNL